jgi:neutral ceramidase
MPRPSIFAILAAGVLLVLTAIALTIRIGSDNAYETDHSNSPLDALKGWSGPDVMQIPSRKSFGDQYLVGVGKADITGPVVEINFMGYADPAQQGTGVRQRLYSRAFIVGDTEKSEDRFAYLVLDTQSGDTAVRYGILQALAELGDEYAVYGTQNVAVTGTHSHSGPGAWLNYLLPQITSKGFNKPSYQAIVDGAVLSIKRAHESLAPGYLDVGSIEIEDANTNRSPFAYLANPEEERARYKHDVDKTMTLLRLAHATEDESEDIGVFTWFPVHGTSMYGNNTLVTGDNKGVAAYLFEKSMSDTSFVAGFSQANVGDTSPNVLGAYCEYGDHAGEMCDFKTSLCGNKTQPCHGRGPYWGRDDGGAASNYEIGRRQYEGARRLWENQDAFTPIRGKVVKPFHQFVDFSNLEITLPNGTLARTCPAAMGYSFAAGTTDGPGAFDFKQAQPGDPHANPLWSAIGNRVHTPNDTQIACQAPKPILLDVGESDSPYEWSPNIIDVQLLRVGQMFIVVAPGEATTMAGRRWKAAVCHEAKTLFSDLASQEPVVVLGGPANTYGHYITTFEEYHVQRYEGASTLYGPYTLSAYINRTIDFLPQLDASASTPISSERGPLPPKNVNNSLTFIAPVVVDRAPFLKSFGDVTADAKPRYLSGQTISARFVGANPRNNFRLGGTFAAVEKYDADSSVWKQVRSDEDWSLVYEWTRTSTMLGTSEVTISWETRWENSAWRDANIHDASREGGHGDLLTRNEELAGRYRLKYYGDAKALGGALTAFEGTSGEFELL